MSNYELLFILKPEFAESELEDVVDNVRELVEKSRGEVKDEDTWGKRDLAYEIDNFRQGFYFVWQVEMPETDVAFFKKNLQMNEDVLRFILVKQG